MSCCRCHLDIMTGWTLLQLTGAHYTTLHITHSALHITHLYTYIEHIRGYVGLPVVAVGLAGHARIHGRSEPSVHGHHLTILEWRPSLGSLCVRSHGRCWPRSPGYCCCCADHMSAARPALEPRTMHATAAAGWSAQTAVMHCCPLHAGTLLTRA